MLYIRTTSQHGKNDPYLKQLRLEMGQLILN